MDAQANFHPASREAAADRARQLTLIDAQADVQLVGRLPDGSTVEVERLGPITLAGDRDPWERQPGEHDLQWQAFVVYRDAPAGRRTLTTVYETLNPGRKVGVDAHHAPEPIPTWATQMRWSGRAVAYDIYQDQLYRQYLEGQRLAARVATADLGAEMHEKAAEALAAYDAVAYVRVKDRETGEMKVVQRTNMTISELVKLAEIGVKLQRLALGEQDGDGPRVAVGVMVQVGDQELVEQARAVISARQGNPVTIDQL
jgi:hypothetical protein